MIKLKELLSERKLNEFDAKMQKNHFLNLVKMEIDSLKGQIAYAKDKVNYKGTPDWEKKEFKGVLKDLLKKLKDSEKHYKRVQKLKEGKLTEGKFKFKGKYLYMPSGEVTSIPKANERDAVIFNHPRFGELKIWQDKGKIYMQGDDFDKYVKTNELEKYLNKNKYKYLGIDSRW